MNEWLEQRAAEVRDSITQIEQLQRELQYLQLGWRPPTGGWTIAQVFEHMLIADGSYLGGITRMIEQGVSGATPYKPTFAGGLLIRSLRPTSPRKVRAPGLYQPGPEPRAHVVEDYLAMRREVLSLVERADGRDLRRNRMTSPVSKLIRLNLGDAILLLVVHTQRHLQQIERIRNHPDFPGAGN